MKSRQMQAHADICTQASVQGSTYKVRFANIKKEHLKPSESRSTQFITLPLNRGCSLR